MEETSSTSGPESPANTDSVTKRIFIGPNGPRAGWRLAIVFLILVGILGGIFRLLNASTNVGQTSMTWKGTGGGAGAAFLLCVIGSWIMSKIERRKMGAYGLPLRSAFGKDFWVGLLWGFLATSSTVAVIWAMHGVQITASSLNGGKLAISAAEWALAFLLVGFNEEYGFRGYIQYTLASGIGFWPAALVVSSLFGLAHMGNSGENIFGEVSVVMFGLLFCLFLKRRGNLWWAVGFHMGYDWAETFFWGEPDSGMLPTTNFLTSTFNGPKWLTGGSVGPEASVITPICLVTVAVLFCLVYRENRYETKFQAPLRREKELAPVV